MRVAQQALSFYIKHFTSLPTRYALLDAELAPDVLDMVG